MADTKISDLTEETDVALGDLLALVDISESGGTTNKVQVGTLLRYDVQPVTVTGSLTAKVRQFVTLNSASAIALTILAAPVAGDELEIFCIDRGATTHTVVLSGSVDWNVGGDQTASFDADADRIRAIAISATRWEIVENTGVTFSA